jgi:deoxyribodipyrimidine photo-lyase
MKHQESLQVFWFRRDLRLEDNAGLFQALSTQKPVLPIFIFDTDILDKLPHRRDARIQFIWNRLQEMQVTLQAIGTGLQVFYGKPVEVFRMLIDQYPIEALFANHDYEPYACQRDTEITNLLLSHQIPFYTSKDQVIFEKSDIVKDDGKPYTVFTPYSRKWKHTLTEQDLNPYPAASYHTYFYKVSANRWPTLADMGFETVDQDFPAATISNQLLEHYAEKRNFPSLPATSRIGVHLRFGTISIRSVAQQAKSCSEAFLNELIWRDFYHMILWNFPSVGKGQSFKSAYDKIHWRNNEVEFQSWCLGQTGYPIVDAGMRELNETGFMHNRVRMIVASFLTKHLLIDWRWGESYFAEKLLDFDLAANNGGWQWAAGSGCDAAPYFRIFNPSLQTKKFDPTGTYIRKWVPEFDSLAYARPIVDHEFARKRCLEVYASALKG